MAPDANRERRLAAWGRRQGRLHVDVSRAKVQRVEVAMREKPFQVAGPPPADWSECDVEAGFDDCVLDQSLALQNLDFGADIAAAAAQQVKFVGHVALTSLPGLDVTKIEAALHAETHMREQRQHDRASKYQCDRRPDRARTVPQQERQLFETYCLGPNFVRAHTRCLSASTSTYSPRTAPGYQLPPPNTRSCH